MEDKPCQLQGQPGRAYRYDSVEWRERVGLSILTNDVIFSAKMNFLKLGVFLVLENKGKIYGI